MLPSTGDRDGNLPQDAEPADKLDLVNALRDRDSVSIAPAQGAT